MAEEIVFKTTVDTGNSVTAINNVDKALKEVNATVKSTSTDSTKAFDDLNKKVESGELSIKQLARAVKEYATIAIMAGEDSPIGQEAIRKAGQLKDRLADLGTQINANANDGRNMQTAIQVGSGVAAGYAVAQGAMALFGSQNKELQKTLVKLQAIQAILAGLEQIRATLEKESLVRLKATQIWNKIKIASEYAYATAIGTSTGALKLAKIAMLALPIVAIIAGIVAIAAAMDAFSDSTAEANAQQAKLNEDQHKRNLKLRGDLDNNLSSFQDNSNRELELMKAKGATDLELFNKEKSILDQRLSMLDMVKSKSKEQYKDVKDTKQKLIILELDYNKKIKDDADKSDDERQKNKDKRDADALRKLQEANAKKLELQQTIEDLLIANIEDNDLRRIAQLEMQQKREREQLVLKFGEDSKLLKELSIKQGAELDALNDEITQAKTEKQAEDDKLLLDIQNKDDKSRLEAKLINIRNDFALEQEVKKELADMELQQALLNTELTDGEIEKLRAEHKAKIDDINKASADKEIENQKTVQKASLDIADQGLQSIQNLSDAFFSIKNANLEKGSKAELENAKKQFNINKALQLGGAVIDGAKAVTASLASSPVAIGPVPNPVGIASLALAVSSSVATIAKIASTKFDGGGSSITSPTVPSGGGGGNEGGSGGFGSGSTSQVSSVGLTDNATGIKVTVVDSEIKAVMDASANASVLSTFGG